MTVSTLRPTSTVSGFGTYNGATAHASANDDSDATYITAPTGVFGLTDLTLPSGAVIKAIAVRLRTAKGSGSSQTMTVTLGPHVASFGLGWVSITTTTPISAPTALSDAEIDAITLALDTHSTTARLYEAYVDVTHVAKPVVTPALPTGTLTDTNVPLVTWADTLDSDGGAQTHYQVRVFSAAQYGAGGFNAASSAATYDSGDVASSDLSHQVVTPLASATYRAYVRVGQTVNGVTHWSDYAYTGFVINVTLPAVPDTPILTPDSANGRIGVHIEGNSGSATTNALEVQRSIDGTTWEPLRLSLAETLAGGGDGIVLATSADLFDYEAPNGTLMSYRVRALHNYSGVWAASAWATTATGSWSGSDWWLKCPESPALNLVVKPNSIPSYQRPARHGVFQALGRADTVIVAEQRGAPRGTLTLDLATHEEAVAVDALLDSNLTLLLQAPPQDHWPDRYVRFGDQDRARWIDKAWIEPVIDTLQWFEVASPAGDIDGWPA